MAQSLKQKWSYERLFQHKGSLEGIKTRLRQIARANSTLAIEATHIYNAIYELQQVDFSKNKELSLTEFLSHRG